MRKSITLFGIFIAQIATAQHDHQKNGAADTTKKSIPQSFHTEIGDAHIMIHYYSPAVRGRVIWGGLVPYGEVWVTGAHRATAWEFTNAIEINKKTFAAGKY